MTLRGEYDGENIVFPAYTTYLTEEETKNAVELLKKIRISDEETAKKLRQQFTDLYAAKLDDAMNEISVTSTLHISGLEDDVHKLGGDIWAYMDFDRYDLDENDNIIEIINYTPLENDDEEDDDFYGYDSF